MEDEVERGDERVDGSGDDGVEEGEARGGRRGVTSVGRSELGVAINSGSAQ